MMDYLIEDEVFYDNSEEAAFFNGVSCLIDMVQYNRFGNALIYLKTAYPEVYNKIIETTLGEEF